MAVPSMLSSLRVGRVWLYDADPANTRVELVVGVPDECLAAVSTPCGAASWVRASTKHSRSSDSTSRWSSPPRTTSDPTGVELEYALLEPTYVGVFVIVQPSADVRKLLAIVTAWGTDLAAAVVREGSGCYVLAVPRRERRGGRSRRHCYPPLREWPQLVMTARLSSPLSSATPAVLAISSAAMSSSLGNRCRPVPLRHHNHPAFHLHALSTPAKGGLDDDEDDG
uniref:Uncharacterized protein n=1 Tax=Oryza barthii TaxID=65489 RepID=A0A0D3GHQ8_9ORYZ